MNHPLSIGQRVFFTVGLVYIYGIILGAVAFSWDWLTGHHLPVMEWWQYLLAPFGIGLGAFALEWVGTQITKGDDVAHPLRKRVPRLLVVFLFLIVLMLGPALYKIAFEQ